MTRMMETEYQLERDYWINVIFPIGPDKGRTHKIAVAGAAGGADTRLRRKLHGAALDGHLRRLLQMGALPGDDPIVINALASSRAPAISPLRHRVPLEHWPEEAREFWRNWQARRDAGAA